MTLRVVRAAMRSETDDELHLSRLLLLLRALGGRNRKAVNGIMKLAKLDFLLRYPTFLERALKAKEKQPFLAAVQEHERTSIESRMVRFRYGPWDGRYRRWIAILFARGLAETHVKGRTIYAGLTEAGAEIADALGDRAAFRDQKARVEVLRKTFGEMPGTRLKDFIYATFPEIIDLKWGEEIHP